MNEVFMSRQPLVNRQSRIIATRLTLHLGDQASTVDAVNTLSALANVWPQSEKPVFISCGRTGCEAGILDWSAPDNATIELAATTLVGQAGPDVIAALQTFQPTICLHFDPQAAQALSAGVQFRFIGFDAHQFQLGQLKLLTARTRTYGIGIAFNVETSEQFRACLEAGITAAAGWFFTSPTGVPAKALSPGQANIVRVLNLVRQNADIREIEAALKLDVAISYKLLRYINAAGFGLSCEIQSFRHAVNMLGYEKLNRWLSLLLGTASKRGRSLSGARGIRVTNRVHDRTVCGPLVSFRDFPILRYAVSLTPSPRSWPSIARSSSIYCFVDTPLSSGRYPTTSPASATGIDSGTLQPNRYPTTSQASAAGIESASPQPNRYPTTSHTSATGIESAGRSNRREDRIGGKIESAGKEGAESKRQPPMWRRRPRVCTATFAAKVA